METTPTFVPVLRPREAGAALFRQAPGRRSRLTQAVGLAFAIRHDPAAAASAHRPGAAALTLF